MCPCGHLKGTLLLLWPGIGVGLMTAWVFGLQSLPTKVGRGKPTIAPTEADSTRIGCKMEEMGRV